MHTVFTLASAAVVVAAVLLFIFLLDLHSEDEYLDEINRKIDEENNS